jgi:hypothetical protein
VSCRLHASAALTPGKGPRYPLYRKLVVSRGGLGTLETGKISLSCRGSNHDCSAIQHSLHTIPTESSRLVLILSPSSSPYLLITLGTRSSENTEALDKPLHVQTTSPTRCKRIFANQRDNNAETVTGAEGQTYCCKVKKGMQDLQQMSQC